MLCRLGYFFLLCLLPASAIGHVNGHSHSPEMEHRHLHVEEPEQASSGHKTPGPRLQTALVKADSSSEHKILQRIATEQQALHQEIQNLHREVVGLRAEQVQPKPTQIIGGIGYIVGLFGLYAWLRARKEVSC